MKSIVVAGLSVAALMASPALAKAKSSRVACAAVTEPQVAAQFDKFNAAFASKNPDTVTSLFTKDAVLLATMSNTPRTDHAGIRDYFVGFLKNSPVGIITSSTIDIGCNQASRVGTWTVTFTDAAGVKTDVKARYSFIYRLDGGKWMIDHLHSSMLPETMRK